jgi:hypothetical protein
MRVVGNVIDFNSYKNYGGKFPTYERALYQQQMERQREKPRSAPVVTLERTFEQPAPQKPKYIPLDQETAVEVWHRAHAGAETQSVIAADIASRGYFMTRHLVSNIKYGREYRDFVKHLFGTERRAMA